MSSSTVGDGSLSSELDSARPTRRAIIADPVLRRDRPRRSASNSGPIRARAPTPRIPASCCTTRPPRPGIHFVHHRPIFDPKIANIEPHVAALGASVSVADFDGDGWPDLYFTNSRFGEPNALYRNSGDGTFEDVAASAGLADLNRPGEGVSMGSVWGDFDNDGREDLLVYRYGYLALFKNVDGQHFEDVTEAAGLRRWVNSNGAIWLDYDRDGLLDLYVTAYFRTTSISGTSTTTRIMHNSFEFADQRRQEPAVPQSRRRQVRGRHRQDGRRQHALDARRRVRRLQRRRLARHLSRERLRPRGAVPQRSRPALRAHHRGSRERIEERHVRRARRRLQPRPARRLRHEHLRARLSLPEQQPAAQRDDATRERASATWPKARSPTPDGRGARSSATSTTTAPTSSSSPTASSPPIRRRTTGTRCRRSPARTAACSRTRATWPAFGNASLSGYERSRVYLNRGVAGWVDVAQQVGATDLYDGRAVALADLSNRGALDVIVANQNQPAMLYRNRPDSTNHWIELHARRHAQQSQRDRRRSGASSRADCKQRRVVDGGMGFASQNDRRLHFGLGHTRVGRPRRDSLAVGHAAGAARTRRSIGFITITEPSVTRHDRRATIVAVTDRRLARLAGERAQRIDPRYLIAFLITLVLVVAQLRYHIVGGYERLARRAAHLHCRPKRCSRGSIRGKVVNLQSAYISGISLTLLLEAAGRRRSGRSSLGGFLAIASKYVLQYRDNHLWNPTNFAIGALLLARAESHVGAEPPVGQRPRDQSRDLDLRAAHRVARARRAHHAHVRRQLPRAEHAARARCSASAGAAGDRADHRTDVSAVRVLHDHRSAHHRARSAMADPRSRCIIAS